MDLSASSWCITTPSVPSGILAGFDTLELEPVTSLCNCKYKLQHKKLLHYFLWNDLTFSPVFVQVFPHIVCGFISSMKKSKTASNAQCTQGSTQTTDNDFHEVQLKKANICIVSMNTKTQHSFTDVGLYHCLVLCDPLFQTSYDPRAKQSSCFWTWHTFVFYFSVEALLWKWRCF